VAATRSLQVNWRPAFPAQRTVRVTLGAQAEAFTARGRETFQDSVYTISPRSDRQGFRTDGPPIEFVKGPDIISDPTPLGAIQVPGDGKPIILHRDGQVTGGYAKIATVASAELDKFGQMMPGDALRFQVVSREEALTLAAQARRRLNVITAFLGGQ
jgi:allophanate hydrolase subunit 2